MKILFRNILLFAGFFGLIIFSACKKQLDINVDPNSPLVDKGNPAVVFPAGVFGTTAAVGTEYAILGGIWGQYFTQAAFSNQYKTIDAYQLNSSDLNRPYRFLFANGLKNYQYVIDKSEEASNWNLYLMGTVMKAYSAQVLVDLYDNIPYFEALQGLNNLSPKFDDGYTIYLDLLKSLDTALAKPIDPSALTPAEISADLIFQGDMEKWIRFANSLEMKMYLRMVNKKPAEAQAGLVKLDTSGAIFLNSDAGVFGFTNVTDKDNPLYEYNSRSLNTSDNLRASKTLSSFLVDNEDPRTASIYGSASPTPINQGDYTGNDPSYSSATVYNPAPTDPVIFMSEAESYFMQAEVKQRYFGGVNAKNFYDLGVLTSFNNFSDTAGLNVNGYIEAGGVYEYPEGGDLEAQIEAISTQKWISCAYGVHFLEGFFEKNRTGYPQTSSVYSTDPAYVSGQFVVSRNSVLGPGLLPHRLPYPQSETQTNSNAPAVVPISTPVWWAK